MCPHGAPAGGDGREFTLGTFTRAADSFGKPRDDGVGPEHMAGIGPDDEPEQLLKLPIQFGRAHGHTAEPSGADGLEVQEQALELVAHPASATSPAWSAACRKASSRVWLTRMRPFTPATSCSRPSSPSRRITQL